jgi:mannosyltransferase OCH1-like enzyme
MVNNIVDDIKWKNAELNFNKHYLECSNKGVENIPKIIHQIWLGGKFPDKYQDLSNSWLDKNPNWKFKLWTDDDLEEFGLVNIKQFNDAPNLGMKSDIFRYEILYRYGGLYIDTDFQCLKSFDDLVYLELFTGTGHMDTPDMFNGLIACKPKHNIMKLLIDGISSIDTNIKDFNKILYTTGPKYFSKLFFEYIKKNPNDKVVLFPTKFFYSLPATMRFAVRDNLDVRKRLVDEHLTDESYCVHLWYTSWQK